MKKLFKKIEGNKFILLTESDMKYADMINGHINDSKSMLRFQIEYLKLVLNSPRATEEDKAVAENGIKFSEDLQKVLEKGRIDTGYQYDDLSPRNQLDAMGDDGFQARAAARTGSTFEDELETEIRLNIVTARQKAKEHELNKYFDDQKGSEIFGDINSDSHPFNYADNSSLNAYVTANYISRKQAEQDHIDYSH